MIRWATDRIAMGGVHDALDGRALIAEGISGVLCLDWFPMIAPSPELNWIRRPLIDGSGNSCADLGDALSKLDKLLAECSRVLVHCREGVSRTPFVVACYLGSGACESVERILEGFQKELGYVAVDPGLLQTWSECHQAKRRRDQFGG